MAQNNLAKFRVSFSPEWVLSKRGDKVLPVELLISKFREAEGFRIISSSLTECTLVAAFPEGKDISEIEKSITDTVCGLYDGEQIKFQLKAEKYIEEEAEIKTDEKKTEKKNPFASAGRAKPKAEKKPVMERIEALIGADEFKALCRETVKIAPVVRKYETFDTVTSRCCLISINDGCGLSTYLRLYAELLEYEELFSIESQTPVVEVSLPPRNGPGVTDALKRVKEALTGTAKSRVVCVDISEWMTASDDIDFRKFLSLCAANAGHHVVFLRVPFVEQNVLEELRQNLNDMLFIHTLSVVPFDNSEIDSFAEMILKEKGFTIDSDAMEAFRERITEEKNDGRFYGIKTVRKVILEMLYHKQLSEAETGNEGTVVKLEEIREITRSENAIGLSGMQMLDQLIGMDAIREQVLEVIAQIEAHMTNDSLGAPCLHMRFVGNPGTGKTTVARIIGRILREKGILRNGSFLEHAGRDLCGKFVGETAPRTAAMCRDAYGSVLFIDEAYTLYRDEYSSGADYGREALDTLIAEMENHRSDLMVIMAGYPSEMDGLMKANPGLVSRMPYKIEFPNYSREQLAEIFLSMAGKSFKYGEELEKAVRDYFGQLSDELLDRKDFSNARYVRNLYERTWAKAALRSQLSGEKCDEITPEDFAMAAGEKDFKQYNEKKNSRSIGFI